MRLPGQGRAARILSIRNRPGSRFIETRRLRRLTNTLLVELLGQEEFCLAICLVPRTQMTRLNETFLRHRGSTDVITFDYLQAQAIAQHPRSRNARGRERKLKVFGDIFICVDEAKDQARTFGTSPGAEVVRYVVHGVLHLLGFEDGKLKERRRMKREEDRLLRALADRFRIA